MFDANTIEGRSRNVQFAEPHSAARLPHLVTWGVI